MSKFPPFLDSLPLYHQGKVRDTFLLPNHPDLLLVVATDRVSTHNVVHESLVPEKGIALTMLSAFWSMFLDHYDISNHVVDYAEGIYRFLPPELVEADQESGALRSRTLVVRRFTVLPIEFIFRSYLAGSLWKKFYSKGISDPYGLGLLPGLELMSSLHVGRPAFTPTEKSETDDPLRAESIEEWFPFAVRLCERAYFVAQRHLNRQGITLVDSKFEVGIDPCEGFVLVDEFCTGDCSRLVRTEDICRGKEPPWADKEILRQEAEWMWGDGPHNPLTFSDEAIERTMGAYKDIAYRVTGSTLEEWIKGDDRELFPNPFGAL